MVADEYAYIGRDNIIRRVLLIDGDALSVAQKAAITKVTVKIGPYCLDTTASEDPIEYSDGTVEIQVGLIPTIKRGMYTAEVTAFDATMPNGKAWGSFTVWVDTWDACDDS